MVGAGMNGLLRSNPPYNAEKHDVLFSKARFVFNQRHIKRPRFKFNPFSLKTNKKSNLENFTPEEGNFLQRLESLVVCESFQQDKCIDTREIELGGYCYTTTSHHVIILLISESVYSCLFISNIEEKISAFSYLK